MRRASSKPVPVPRRRGDPSTPVERVNINVRATQEQKDFLSRLGGGSVSRGFDKAVAVASDRHVLG